MSDERIPLTIVTGFLGSGKTTLIRRYLQSETTRVIGVVINEFGEVGVDDAILVHATENLSVVAGGCACCAKRADIARSIHDLLSHQRSKAPVSHLVLETSGLADPAPIVTTLLSDPWLLSRIRLAHVLAVVDGVAGLANLDSRVEACKQVALADTVVISKADIVGSERIAALTVRLAQIAPDVSILNSTDDAFDIISALWAPSARVYAAGVEPPGSSHDAAGTYRSHQWRFNEPVDWSLLTIWLSALLHAHGDRIVRVKGMIRTSNRRSRIALHGVQHLLHAPTHIEGDEVDESYLIFITRDFDSDRLQAAFTDFVGRFASTLRASQPGEARRPALT
jgi:G3E family GTPase